MAKLFNPFFQAIDGNGNPLAGAKLYFYRTGTTTPQDTFSQSDCAAGHENTNPVVADANGRFGPIYMTQTLDYKAILKDSSDVTVGNGTLDPLLINTTSVITTQGDLIIGNASGADSRLPINANADASLRSNGTTAEWRRANYTVQVFLSGSGTYTKPANCTALRVRVLAGGGGGGGCGGTTGPGGAPGGTSSFNSVTAVGGTGGVGNATGTGLTGAGGVGGTGGTGSASLRLAGGQGSLGTDVAIGKGAGGSSAMGQGAPAAVGAAGTASTGIAAAANSGGGGGPASSQGTTAAAAAGGAGEYFELAILAPSATYPYAVGGGGAGGIGTGTGAATGGAGGSGIVIVEESYS